MFFKRKKKLDLNKEPLVLLFVCLADLHSMNWPDVQGADRDDSEDPDGRGRSVSIYEFDRGRVIAAYMPAPIPGNEVEAQIPYSNFWEDSLPTRHEAHVMLMGSGTSNKRAMEVAALVAAQISRANHTVAWYIGNASHIVQPAIAEDLAGNDARIALFVNVPQSPNPDGGIDASTIGMESFGHLEFEVIGTKMGGQPVFELLLDVASYVLDGGPVLKHNNTFEIGGSERFRIEIGRSRLGKHGEVLRLHIP